MIGWLQISASCWTFGSSLLRSLQRMSLYETVEREVGKLTKSGWCLLMGALEAVSKHCSAAASQDDTLHDDLAWLAAICMLLPTLEALGIDPWIPLQRILTSAIVALKRISYVDGTCCNSFKLPCLTDTGLLNRFHLFASKPYGLIMWKTAAKPLFLSQVP